MSDVLILALNSKYIHSSLAPWYLKSAVDPLALNCVVAEHTVNEDIEDVIADILNMSPKLLAISVYIWNVQYTYKLIEKAKEKLPLIKIVLGGPEVSYNPRDVLLSCKADFVISGEGEKPFFSLCEHLFFGKALDRQGISYVKSGEISISQPYIGVGTPKSPYTAEYFAALKGRIAYFESSRGCPYSCAYCLSGRNEGLRFFDMEYVSDNLIKLANSGTKTVKFVDRTFNADKRRAIEIWRLIISESGKSFPSDVCFHFELSGDLIDDETVELLKSAPEGLFQFEIGIQSFCEKTIGCIHRVTDSAKLKSKIKALVEMKNAHIHTDLIAGLPYEGYESFRDSFNQAYLLGADMLQLGFLKILHGTELEDRAKEYSLKFSLLPPYEVYETPWLSGKEIEKLKTVEKAVDKLHNSGRFRRTLGILAKRFETPFDFFFEVGCALNGAKGLDELTDRLFGYICEKFPDSREEFRDALVCDRLATNSSKVLPKSLYRSDRALARIRKAIYENEPHKRKNVAILYGSQKIVCADYTNKNYRGEYRLIFFRMEDFKNEKD